MHRLFFSDIIFNIVIVIYRLDVTIKNRYGKEVKILKTDVKHEFIIPPGETYQINSTSVRILIITAYENATFRPIKINGEEFISLSSKSVAFNVKPVSRVFCVQSGKLWTNFTEICEFVATMQVDYQHACFRSVVIGCEI